jgi:hypothetical protein
VHHVDFFVRRAQFDRTLIVNGLIVGGAVMFGFFMFVGLPFFIARAIYRDAQNLDAEHALMYALLAFFVPLYLGIAFYMFRKDALEARARNHEPF